MPFKVFLVKEIMKICQLFPIERKIVFVSYGGQFCNCSPMALFNQFRKKLPDYKSIWLMNDASAKIDGASVVKRKSLKAIYHLATAKLWIDNGVKPLWITKRKGQYYVKTDMLPFR